MRHGKLIITQIDHSSGEIIGHAIQKLFYLGVWNAQLLQSVTKKNRPGYVLFIDLPEELVEKVTVFLASELGIWGYHILETSHVHFDISFHEKELHLAAENNKRVINLKPKYIYNKNKLLNIKIDHDELVKIQEILGEWGYDYPLDILRSKLESELWENQEKKITIYISKRQKKFLAINE